jgi:hypothetical protein
MLLPPPPPPALLLLLQVHSWPWTPSMLLQDAV